MRQLTAMAAILCLTAVGGLRAVVDTLVGDRLAAPERLHQLEALVHHVRPRDRADMMDVLPKGDNPETIKVFTIAYGAKADKLFLKELSNRTNARTFESTASNIGAVYKELSANF